MCIYIYTHMCVYIYIYTYTYKYQLSRIRILNVIRCFLDIECISLIKRGEGTVDWDTVASNCWAGSCWSNSNWRISSKSSNWEIWARCGFPTVSSPLPTCMKSKAWSALFLTLDYVNMWYRAELTPAISLSLSLSLYIYIYMHTLIHAYIYIHIYIYIYMYVYVLGNRGLKKGEPQLRQQFLKRVSRKWWTPISEK